MAGMEMISADRLDEYVNRADCLLIDLRDRGEYEAGHIKMPSVCRLTTCWHMSASRKTVCSFFTATGVHEYGSGKKLAAHGYRVVSVVGGMHAYRGKYLVK